MKCPFKRTDLMECGDVKEFVGGDCIGAECELWHKAMGRCYLATFCEDVWKINNNLENIANNLPAKRTI